MTLVVYEYQHEGYTPQYLCSRKQVISYRQSNLVLDEKLYLTGYLIPLMLMGDAKPIIVLWLSASQVSRLAKYLRVKKWDGGFTMCPWNSWPQVTIHAISEMPDLTSGTQENKRRTDWGLFFALYDSDIIIEWIPEDREATSKSLGEIAKKSYQLRSQEPKGENPQIDIEEYKHHLFGV